MDSVTSLAAVAIAALVLSSGQAPDLQQRGAHLGLSGTVQAAESQSVRKVALMVGINNYPNLRPSEQLKGPVRDAVLIAETLQLPKYGFQANDIHVFVSPGPGDEVPKTNTDVHVLPGQVTKRTIFEAFRKYLIDEVRPGDIVVFFYSGHGSLWHDPQEPSRRARTLVPTDSRGQSGTDILTAELASLVTEALARNPRSMTIILDSCYSGSRVRGVARVRGIRPDLRSGALEQYRQAFRAAQGRGGNIAASGDQSFFSIDRKYVLLAAAREDQLALEEAPTEDAPVNGVFTRFLADALRSSTTSSRTTYRELMERIAVRVLGDTAGGQVPILEGERDMGLFGGQVRDQLPYVTVGSRIQGNNSIVLPTGRAAGATVGSLYDIYPRDDFIFSDPSRRIGIVRIAQASIGESVAKLVSGSAPEGAHAVERIHRQSATLRVKFLSNDIPEVFVRTLKEKIRASPFSFTFTNGPGYDVAISSSHGRIRAELPSGEDLGPSYAIKNSQTPANLAVNIIKFARVRWVTALDNPSSMVKFSVTWTPATYDKASIRSLNGYPVLRAASGIIGDEIAFTVANRSKNPAECPLYAAIVNIAVDGSIVVVPEHNETGIRIEDIPWSGVRFRMLVPKDIPAFRRGREIFKVVVATDPINLRTFEQRGYHAAPTRALHVSCAEDWGVKDFVFWVDRVKS